MLHKPKADKQRLVEANAYEREEIAHEDHRRDESKPNDERNDLGREDAPRCEDKKAAKDRRADVSWRKP